MCQCQTANHINSEKQYFEYTQIPNTQLLQQFEQPDTYVPSSGYSGNPQATKQDTMLKNRSETIDLTLTKSYYFRLDLVDRLEP